jgi:heat shock protein HslJ
MNSKLSMRRVFGVIAIAALVLVAACTPAPAVQPEDQEAGLANPASVYCEEQGGQLEMRTDEEGTHGVCRFDDGSECEEWAFFRGECESGEKPSDNEELDLENELAGTDWDLVMLGNGTLLPDSKITIAFDQEGLRGSAGCNGYFGSYTLERAEFAMGPLASTAMDCEGLMDQEQNFLELLSSAESLTFEEKQLIIHGGGGDLLFQPAVHETLLGNIWVLNGIVHNGAIVTTWIDEEITAEFIDGQIAGSAGCNSYFAGYDIDGDALTFGSVGSTKMLCDEERNQREAEFLAALAAVAGHTIQRDRLTLTDADGNQLIQFRVQDEPDVPDALLGQVWYWQEYLDTAGIHNILVGKPADYTLELLEDGTYRFQADCNQGNGGYQLDGSGLAFEPGPITLAACEPGSLDTDFLAKLGDVVTYVLEDGKLHLNLKMDAGNMVFSTINDPSWTQFKYTFEDSPDGWSHGFADLPADADPQFYQLDGGRRALPGELVGGGYNLRGDNHSDDLFMFLKVQAGGLEPNTTYDVKFLVDLATAVPEGLMGIGGSPGESVYLKVGASSIEPSAVEDGSGYLRMNIDKGQQAQGGADMIVLGHIAYASDSAADGGEWQMKSLDSTEQPFSIITDDSGQVWFIIGTDSGFEGLTDVYFDAISISLTPATD